MIRGPLGHGHMTKYPLKELELIDKFYVPPHPKL